MVGGFANQFSGCTLLRNGSIAAFEVRLRKFDLILARLDRALGQIGLVLAIVIRYYFRVHFNEI